MQKSNVWDLPGIPHFSRAVNHLLQKLFRLKNVVTSGLMWVCCRSFSLVNRAHVFSRCPSLGPHRNAFCGNSETCNSLEKAPVNGTLSSRYVRVSKLGYRSRYSEDVRARRPGFDSWQWQDISLLHSVQTGSGAHAACYPVGTERLFPRR
jgi:hypothetical protein